MSRGEPERDGAAGVTEHGVWSMEYYSIVWHDNLTQAQTNAIERLQIVALKIILGSVCPRLEDGHFNYKALTICKIDSLFSRRKKTSLRF